MIFTFFVACPSQIFNPDILKAITGDVIYIMTISPGSLAIVSGTIGGYVTKAKPKRSFLGIVAIRTKETISVTLNS